jgi:hypothetical protein
MTRSTRPHVFVQHHHPGQKQKHHGNNGMTPKHEGHPKDCNDEANQCHPAISKAAFAIRWKIRKRRQAVETFPSLLVKYRSHSCPAMPLDSAICFVVMAEISMS